MSYLDEQAQLEEEIITKYPKLVTSYKNFSNSSLKEYHQLYQQFDDIVKRYIYIILQTVKTSEQWKEYENNPEKRDGLMSKYFDISFWIKEAISLQTLRTQAQLLKVVDTAWNSRWSTAWTSKESIETLNITSSTQEEKPKKWRPRKKIERIPSLREVQETIPLQTLGVQTQETWLETVDTAWNPSWNTTWTSKKSTETSNITSPTQEEKPKKWRPRKKIESILSLREVEVNINTYLYDLSKLSANSIDITQGDFLDSANDDVILARQAYRYYLRIKEICTLEIQATFNQDESIIVNGIERIYNLLKTWDLHIKPHLEALKLTKEIEVLQGIDRYLTLLLQLSWGEININKNSFLENTYTNKDPTIRLAQQVYWYYLGWKEKETKNLIGKLFNVYKSRVAGGITRIEELMECGDTRIQIYLKALKSEL